MNMENSSLILKKKDINLRRKITPTFTGRGLVLCIHASKYCRKLFNNRGNGEVNENKLDQINLGHTFSNDVHQTHDLYFVCYQRFQRP